MSDHIEHNKIASQANKKNRTYILVMLFIAYTFNFIDRQILVILAEPIKNDLGLSDKQLGILTGFSFAIFYVTAGIPIARWADKANRTKIISGAVAVWSGMTALSGLVSNYAQLVAARIGVGIGEAGCSPPAHSMISDMYEREERATALSIYSTGIYVGIFIGFLIGGFVQQYAGWRATFLIVGLPGILLAAIFYMTVKEPMRRMHTEDQDDQYSMIDSMKEIWAKKSFKYISLGCAFASFVAYGTGNFMPSYLFRSHNMTAGEIGLALSVITGAGGIIGTYLGGYLTDKFGKSDKRWYLWVPTIGATTALPIYIMTFYSDDTVTALTIMPFAIIAATLYLGPSIACCHMVVSPSKRAMASALLFFILNLIGLGLGPLFIGAISDALLDTYGTESLRYAMMIGSCFGLLAAAMFVMGAKHLPKEIKKVS